MMVQKVDRLGAMLKRVDRRLQVVGLSDRAASLKADRSRDLIRTIRRQHASGTQRSVSASTLVALAQVLETTIDWLKDGVGAEEVSNTDELIGKLHALEIENRWLKQLLGEKALENAMVQGLVRKT